MRKFKVFIFLLIYDTLWTRIGSSYVKQSALITRFLTKDKTPPVQLLYAHPLQKPLQPGKEFILPATSLKFPVNHLNYI